MQVAKPDDETEMFLRGLPIRLFHRVIVEAHGGTLRCVNGRSGARFEIRLPRRDL